MLLLVFLLIVKCSFAQGDFAPIGAKWYYSQGYDLDLRLGYIEETVTKDTTINGQFCRKIERRELVKIDNIPNSQIDTNSLDSKYVYANVDTVFYYNSPFDKFLPLYIFNVAMGDTICYHVPDTSFLHTYPDSLFKVAVERIEVLQINGSNLKKISTTNTIGYGDPFIYTERIGSEKSLLLTLSGTFGTPSLLRCYSDANLSYIVDTNTPCDYVDGPTSINGKQSNNLNISVYPNPAQDYLNIKTDGINLNDTDIHIYDVVGKKVHASITNSRIDVSALAKGVYLIKITVGEDYVVKKILINKI